jgi:hypothetical protein
MPGALATGFDTVPLLRAGAARVAGEHILG